MASYVLLFNCVVFCVLFGSVVCAGGSSGVEGSSRGEGTSGASSSEPDHWMKGQEIQYVKLQEHFGKKKKYVDALFKAKFHEDTGTWCWDYYDAGDWHHKFGLKSWAKPAGSIPIDTLTAQTRDGKAISYLRGPNRYTATFAKEQDAITANEGPKLFASLSV